MNVHVPRLTGQVLVAIGLVAALVGVRPAGAAEGPVLLGTAGNYAVLAGSTVTNAGATQIRGDLGVSPGTSVTGFPPGQMLSGTIHVADGVAHQAQLDLVAAYDDAGQRSPTATVTADLGGQTLVPGVYAGSTLGLTGTVTLDAQGAADAVFIFQAESTLITGSTSTVALLNGAQACNVYWRVGSSATLGTGSVFAGTILASASITANTGASVVGRLLAREAAVTLASNLVTRPSCASTTTTTTVQPTSTSSTTTLPADAIAGTGGSTLGGAPRGGAGGGGASGGSTSGGRAVDQSTARGSRASSDGATSGGGAGTGRVTRLPVTGRGLGTMTLAGLAAIGLGSAALLASRREVGRTRPNR